MSTGYVPVGAQGTEGSIQLNDVASPGGMDTWSLRSEVCRADPHRRKRHRPFFCQAAIDSQAQRGHH